MIDCLSLDEEGFFSDTSTGILHSSSNDKPYSVYLLCGEHVSVTVNWDRLFAVVALGEILSKAA